MLKKKKFKAFLTKFILFVHDKYVHEDWDVYTTFGKLCIFFPWLIRAICIWAISPVLLPEYFFKHSKFYKRIQILKNTPEYRAQMVKLTSINTNI